MSENSSDFFVFLCQIGSDESRIDMNIEHYFCPAIFGLIKFVNNVFQL